MTVPRNVRVVRQEQAAGVADLPAEVSLALTDIVAVAREGLLAMSVAAGMAVMQTMFEAESPPWLARRASTTPTGGRCGTAPGRDR